MDYLTPTLFRFSTEMPGSGEGGMVVVVEAEALRPERGSRDALGAPLEPDLPARVVIWNVVDQRGDPVDFAGNEAWFTAEAERRHRKWAMM